MQQTPKNIFYSSFSQLCASAINHKFVDLPVKIVIFHRKTLLICWGKIDPINQECLLLQLETFIASKRANRPNYQLFVALTIQKKKTKTYCAPIRIGPRSVL